MSLIDAEQDDRAVVEAEDAAITATEPPPDTIPTGADLARLIEGLTNGGAEDAQVPQRHREG